MSAALLPALPATRDSPSIAPHLLHSPSHSPVLDLHQIMHNYRDPGPDSPHTMYYPPTPPSDVPPASPIASPSGMLVVHSYGPASGPPGAPLTAQVDFRNLSGTNVRLRIVFGDLALPTSVMSNIPSPERVPALGQERGDWNLKIVVPPIGDASNHMAEVGPGGHLEWPLTLQALDSGGNLLDTIGFGLFVYESPPVSQKPSPTASPPERHRSRSASPNKRSRRDEDYSPPTPTKRLAIDGEGMNLRRMPVASADAYFSASQQGPTANRVFIDGPTPAPSQTLPPGMSLHPHVFQHHLQIQTTNHPQHMSSEALAVQPLPEDYADEGPALIRTTQLVSSGERIVGAKAAQASVSVQGDLDSMRHGWSEAERAAGRRLVQFWKRQVGTTLHVSFTAIPQHQYTDNTIVVSCIYRENIDECFITSVDVIYLLEALAGNRFEVEEKNRIRRNLEGFKPMTISKSKPGTENFFRAIMEFAAPKPRNIEKDVKVFEWGKLKMMLEKVFSKYSTVPVSSGTPSPHYDGPAPGISGSYPFPSQDGAATNTSNEPPRTARSRSPKLRRKRSPAPGSRLHDAYTQQESSNPRDSYTEQLAPTKYSDALDYNPALESGEYAFGGIRFLDIPSELDTGLFKSEMSASEGNVGNLNGHPLVAVPPEAPDMERTLDDIRSASPPSSDNSPVSMTLSISSGSSSDADGKTESLDVISLPGSEPEHLKSTQSV